MALARRSSDSVLLFEGVRGGLWCRAGIRLAGVNETSVLVASPAVTRSGRCRGPGSGGFSRRVACGEPGVNQRGISCVLRAGPGPGDAARGGRLLAGRWWLWGWLAGGSHAWCYPDPGAGLAAAGAACGGGGGAGAGRGYGAAAAAGQRGGQGAATAWTISTVAGGVGGPAKATQVSVSPYGVFYGTGGLYLADWGSVARVDPQTDQLAPVAGTGVAGPLGDRGAAIKASMIPFQPLSGVLPGTTSVAQDTSGNLLIADQGYQRVRVVAARTGTFYGQKMTAGDIYTVAGDGQLGFSGDGGRPQRPRLVRPAVWRWTPRATWSSPTAATPGCGWWRNTLARFTGRR